jgi:hypothetical protein
LAQSQGIGEDFSTQRCREREEPQRNQEESHSKVSWPMIMRNDFLADLRVLCAFALKVVSIESVSD